MSLPINGYSSAKLLRSSRFTRTYEATREDGLEVVAKVFDLDHPDVEAHVLHAVAAIRELAVEGVVSPIGVERGDGQLVVLFEHINGVDLAEFSAGEALPLDTFIPIARRLAETLVILHEHHVIHGDIKPGLILVSHDGGNIYFAELGIRALLQRDLDLDRSETLRRTLPYLSPEHTERTGRVVDARSDLYSLGAVFYELLTGTVPFTGERAHDLIHALLVETPKTPRGHRPQLPEALSRMVMKLLEKVPERRYQSAAGLLCDLRQLKASLEAAETQQPFELGVEDRRGELCSPRRLYGREHEQALLIAELEHATRQARPRLILISGPPGIGKSALADAHEPEVLRRHGIVGRGRFDPERLRLPYAGWVQALDHTLAQLLTGPSEELEVWRGRLKARLGKLAPVVGALLPSLGRILGRPPAELARIRPREAKNRLQLAISRLLAALSEAGPLVLILDDLHAADDSSLDLLAALLDGGDCGPTLLVGTYRPASLHDGHRLLTLAERVGARVKSESPLSRLRGRKIELGPLADQASALLIRDLLGDEDHEFAGGVIRASQNNPEFALLFIEHLRRVKLLEHREGRWCWTHEAIASAEVPSDVIGILRAQLEQLDDTSAELLQRAACIGDEFQLRELELATGHEPAQLLRELSPLLAAGLILGVGLGYRFAHPRIRKVASADLAASERRAIHWRLGQAAFDMEPAKAPSAQVWYGLVDHLDVGLDDVTKLSAKEREQLAQLNLDVGLRALVVASPGTALRYLELAAALVAERASVVRERGTNTDGAGLVFEIYFARAQAQSLIGEHDAAEAAFDELLDWQLSISEYGRAVAGRVLLLSVRDRNQEAVAHALVGLRRCGYSVNAQPSSLALLLAVARASLRFRGRSMESLMALPAATDPSACAAMSIASAVGHAAYTVEPKLFVILSTVQVGLLFRHGRHSTTPQAVAQLALAVATVLRRSREAGRLADVALAMADGVHRPEYARAEVVVNMVWHLSRPFASTVEGLELAYQRNLDLGEFEIVGYLALLSLSISIEIGTHLRTQVEICHRLERDLGNWGAPTMKTLVRLNGALAAALAGDLDAGLGEIVVDEQGTPRVLPVNPESLIDLPQMEQYSAKAIRATFYVLMSDYEAGLRLFDEIHDYPRMMLGSSTIPRVAMAHAVAAAASYRHADAQERRRLLGIIKRHRSLTARWVRTCRANYGHLHDLVEAEYSMIRGRFQRGIELLERARDRAKRQRATYVAALACERMAAHMEAHDLPTLARGPLREAWLIYQRWGARAKLRQLEDDQSVDEVSGLGRSSAEHRAAPSNHGLGNLAIDLATVTSALAAISEELDPELLVCKILEAAMTHAGADHGALLVEGEDAGELALAALGSSARRVHALSPPLDLVSANEMLPMSVINFVARTGKSVVVDDARADARFARDPYVERTKLRSLLCIPLGKRRRQLGMLVLESRRSAARFDEDRLSVLGFVAAQAGGALDNANLYRALRRSEIQWRSLVDGAPDLIALLDAQGELTFVNRSLPGWVVGRKPTLDPDSRSGWARAIEGALKHGARDAVEIALIHREDEEQLHWYDAHVAPLEIEDEARRVMVIATEITERKLADALRMELEGRLRQQQRLESLGTLASGVAHEINNPVQGILNYAELLVGAKTKPDLVDEFASEITTEAERVATIVRSLLAFSRREAAPERELVTINAVIEGTLSLIHSTLRKHDIEVHVSVPPDLPPVRCHSQQIQQIIMNLVTNARDALNDRWPEHHSNKIIDINAGTIERQGRTMVRVSVIDQGGGIPEAVRAHIFDPFFTTKGRDQGTGLGLSVSHGIAQDHGGELSLETRVGEGTSFHLELPAVPMLD